MRYLITHALKSYKTETWPLHRVSQPIRDGASVGFFRLEKKREKSTKRTRTIVKVVLRRPSPLTRTLRRYADNSMHLARERRGTLPPTPLLFAPIYRHATTAIFRDIERTARARTHLSVGPDTRGTIHARARDIASALSAVITRYYTN